MDSTFVWVLMFAGAAVALLGVFLVASERELKVKRREIETLLTKLENTPQGTVSTDSVEPEAAPAELAELRAQNRNLQTELNTLSTELDQSRRAIAELRASEQNSAGSRLEIQQLSEANDRLSREVNELHGRLAAGEAQDRENDTHAQMQAELDDLRRALRESHTRMRDLESASQNLADVNAIEAAHQQQRESLEQHIAELAQEVSNSRESLAGLQTLHDRLAEAENARNSLREELRQHEEEIPRWQARITAGEESRRRLAALQAPCNELLSKQAALADRQRQLQEELMAFARMIEETADATEQSNFAPAVGPGRDEESNSPTAASPTRSTSSANYSGVLEGTPELRAAQEAEPASNAAPASGGRRYGILGVLLLVATVSIFGFKLFIVDSEQASGRTDTAKLPGASVPMQLSEPTVSRRSEAKPVETSSPAAAHAAVQLAPAIRENPAPAIIDTAKSERPTLGTYRVVRATRVYAAPNEVSRSIGAIEPGINVNVVDARDGWLEIHSKHGRPPGFIRREAAARVTGQN